MATLSAFSSLVTSIGATNFTSRDLACSPNCVRFRPKSCGGGSLWSSAFSLDKKRSCYRIKKLRSSEEESMVTEQDEAGQEPVSSEEQDQVFVPVSPSDTLNMFFQADGVLNETEIPKVTKALQAADGVTDLNVQVIEGIATVELTKQTTIQATGVASSLVEIIQGAGFKLQTLNLSFQDEEDVLSRSSAYGS